MVLRAENPSESALRRREGRARLRAGWRQRCCVCEQVFVPGRADRVFCGAACRQKDYRQRMAAGADAPPRPKFARWQALGVSRPPKAVPRPVAAPEPPLTIWSGGRRIDITALIG